MAAFVIGQEKLNFSCSVLANDTLYCTKSFSYIQWKNKLSTPWTVK